MNKKLNIIGTVISGGLLITSLIIPQISFGQQTASVNVNRLAFITFLSLPQPFLLETDDGQGKDIMPDGDVNSGNNGVLRDTRTLTVQDIRNSGGFDLNVSAEDFTGPENSTISAANLRILTSTHISNPPSVDHENNGILYLHGDTGFIGNYSAATAPLDAGDSYNFGVASNFTSKNNTLNNPVTLINGCLPSTDGRNGEMSLGTAFYFLAPSYPIPGQYDSKITFTLTDHTSDHC